MVLLKSAPAPVAVFSSALLASSAPAPMAVLKAPVVSLLSDKNPTTVLKPLVESGKLSATTDFAAVRDNSVLRAQSLQRVRGSAQIEVPDADHFFAGYESVLVARVKLFLDQRLR